MTEKCNVCNSLVYEITLFNGETKHFCSAECFKANELIECFRDFAQSKIDKYNKHIHKDDLIDFLHPQIKKGIIKDLISEVLHRDYFVMDKGFIFKKGTIIALPSRKD